MAETHCTHSIVILRYATGRHKRKQLYIEQQQVLLICVSIEIDLMTTAFTESI